MSPKSRVTTSSADRHRPLIVVDLYQVELGVEPHHHLGAGPDGVLLEIEVTGDLFDLFADKIGASGSCQGRQQEQDQTADPYPGERAEAFLLRWSRCHGRRRWRSLGLVHNWLPSRCCRGLSQ
jgi:hypothetical protein